MNKLLNYLMGGLLLAAMVSQSTIAAPSDQAAHTEEGAQHADEKHHSEEEHAGEDHAEDEGDHAEEAGHEGHEDEEPELTFSADLLRDFGGEIATAEAGVIRQQVSLPGEVKLNEEAVAHITPRFAAKIVEVQAKTGDRVKAGDVVIVRYEGPRGGPGMQEMLSPTSAIMGMGLGEALLLGDGAADASMQFDGTIADINNALDGLTFDPGAAGCGGERGRCDATDAVPPQRYRPTRPSPGWP